MRRRLVSLATVAVFAWQTAGVAFGQTTADPRSGARRSDQRRPAVPPDELPVSVDRIQRVLDSGPGLQLPDDVQPMFRVEVYGTRIPLAAIIDPRELVGPVPYGGLTHSEFLKMVTPRLAQPYGAFNSKELAWVAGTSLLQALLLKAAVAKFREAVEAREKQKAKEEVDRAMEEWEKARKPPA
jgi:hypothetical protein